MRGRAIVAPLVDRLVSTDDRLTSTRNPIRVNWVDIAHVPGLAALPGRLGMTFLPGKRRSGIAGDHWRDPDIDAARLRDHWHVDTLLLLVDDYDLEAAHVGDIAACMKRNNVDLVRFAIPDGSAPTDRADFRVTLDDILRRLATGRSIAVACVGGLGRTGTAVACLLRDGGLPANEAIWLTRQARRGTIENRDQEAFVRGWDWPGHLAAVVADA